MLINKHRLQKTAAVLFRYMTDERHSGNWGMDIHHWDWVPGVGVGSLWEYGIAAGAPEAVSYCLQWVNLNRHKAKDARVINAFAPYAIYPGLYRLTGEERLLHEAEEAAAWLLAEAPRTREGALEHTVTEDAAFPEQVWADTVYMAVLFLARLAGGTGSRPYAEAAAEQTLLHLRLLQDTQSGLLFHGWNSREASHMSAVRWARANAWIILAVPQIVAEIRDIAAIPDELYSRYTALAAGLRSIQNKGGLWHTVLNRADTVTETSASAGIACGFLLGVREGLLDAFYLDSAKLAVSGILPLITQDGEVQGVSGGTPVMPSVEAYNRIPVYPTLYGQGLTLQLLSQALSLYD
ncbi:glycoside hydrolase family 88 protein [Paenibacillus tengchongensis]|uniref:glycoside hydrolase family 88 protein n=1 Tax=Paenibacillus tengchongensis TaxID=2608684 RepID=UPI001FE599A1|nr:glycoside hydrolase family 88 protein [Paenibacillus tengchongensis]